MTTFQPVVEPGIFDSEEVERNSSQDPAWYARHESTLYMIDEACRVLGVTKRHLALLLGLPHSQVYQVYVWTSPVRRIRIGQKYALRLSLLLAKAAQGMNFATISEIDWTTGDGAIQESRAKEDRRIPKAVRRGLHNNETPA